MPINLERLRRALGRLDTDAQRAREERVDFTLKALGWGEGGDKTPLAVLKAIDTIGEKNLTNPNEIALNAVLGGKRKIRQEEVEKLRETGMRLIDRALLSPDVDAEGFSRLGFERQGTRA